ncbi:MAG: T9SS type A sorting domain-containing protein [Bacteroidales bacterium]|nr:T9SS type A sorting domain-containing protein [Bacteroidales bacterium]
MKRILFLLTLWNIIGNHNGISQLITTSPAIPLDSYEVTVTFDATQGDKGLMGFTGDVYAHMGVITDKSTSGGDWKYVKADWNVNLPECKFERIGTDLYQLILSPTIRDFFGVPDGEKILYIAFVFRSPDGSVTGRDVGGSDIFVDVFEEGLTLSIKKPFSFPAIINLYDSLIIEAQANGSDSMVLYKDDVLVQQAAGESLYDTLTGDNYGKFIVKVVAVNDTGSVADSFICVVRTPADTLELPEGIRDGINYVDTSTVILSLFAPYKEYVYATGDFNDWELDSNSMMHRTPDGQRFWIEIRDLTPRKEYVFQYIVDGNIRIGDPYADKVIDQLNDPEISDEIYPNLIPFPAGKSSGIASVLQTGQIPYAWQISDFTPKPSAELIIYEILVRDFTSKHSFQAILDTIGYLQRLGVNAIELMPVSEFEGNSGWGYNPSYYFAPDKYYGTKNDLKKLIDECHKRDMAVIMDMVLNHAYDQCPFVQLYFEGGNPAAANPWFNNKSNFENPDAQWGNDFNHESVYTQQLVDSINSYWMSEYRMDGFRFDFTKGFGNNIKDAVTDSWGSKYDADRIRLLKRMSDAIWNRNPNAVIIMEHLAENLEEEELSDYGILLWGNMNYNYCEAAMGWNENNKSDLSGISYKNRTWSDPHLVGYMESHDEQRLMYKCLRWGNHSEGYAIQDTTIGLRRIALNAVFFLTVPGPKMIWQFGERGYDFSIDSLGRLGEKPPKWEYMNDSRRRYLYNFYTALIDLRKKHPVFHTDDFTMNVNSSLKRIVLHNTDMNVVIIGNFSVTAGEISGEFSHTGKWYDYFTGDSVEVNNVSDPIALSAGEYHLFTDKQLETPDIGTGMDDHSLPIFNGQLIIFPNPATDYITILAKGITPTEPVKDKRHVEIYDLTGRMVLQHEIDQQKDIYPINISILKAGTYLFLLKEKEITTIQSKFVVVD